MKEKASTIALAAFFICLTLFAWLKPADDFSESERRVLAKMPELNRISIADGSFMSDFETFALDQFPMRDTFRALKSGMALHVFRMGDTNGLYLKEGHIAKTEETLNIKMLDHAANRFRHIYEKYLKSSDVFFTLIPDKHYFLGDGRLSIDYSALAAYMREKTEYAKYIDMFDILSVSNFYYTDSHWRQECILPVADRLGEKMGFSLNSEYTENRSETPFYGVYAGQLALPVKPDDLIYLTSPTLDACTLTSYDTGKPESVPIYDMDAVQGRDPYEMFMCGADALLVLENPNASEKRELVIFRDSYASSLVPLLAEAYSKITLVDIRYIHPDMLASFVSFEDAQVLFMYSTSLVNNSLALK